MSLDSVIPDDYIIYVYSKNTICKSCRRIISTGDLVIEIAKATKHCNARFLCETCSDIYFSVKEAECDSYDNPLDTIKEYQNGLRQHQEECD